MEEKGYAIRIKPSGVIEKLETEGGYEEIQRLVGGFFEIAILDEYVGIAMMVDEGGKLKGKPFNLLASCIYRNPYDSIVGDAVFMKLERVGEYWELDTVPFSESEVDILLGELEDIRERVLFGRRPCEVKEGEGVE